MIKYQLQKTYPEQHQTTSPFFQIIFNHIQQFHPLNVLLKREGLHVNLCFAVQKDFSTSETNYKQKSEVVAIKAEPFYEKSPGRLSPAVCC